MGSVFEIVTLRGTCEGDRVCPAVHQVVGEPDVLYVQGWVLTDRDKLAAFGAPPGETVIAVPRSLLPEVR